MWTCLLLELRHLAVCNKIHYHLQTNTKSNGQISSNLCCVFTSMWNSLAVVTNQAHKWHKMLNVLYWKSFVTLTSVKIHFKGIEYPQLKVGLTVSYMGQSWQIKYSTPIDQRSKSGGVTHGPGVTKQLDLRLCPISLHLIWVINGIPPQSSNRFKYLVLNEHIVSLVLVFSVVKLTFY